MSADAAALAHLRHELRTPLNHIIGYSEMLLEEIGDDPGAELGVELRQIREDARTLLASINQRLAPARADGAVVDSRDWPASLSDPLRRIVDATAAAKRCCREPTAPGLVGDLERIATAAAHLGHLLAHGVPDATGPEARPPAASSATIPGVLAPGTGAGRILVVDDNPDNRDMLSRRLARQGHQVRTAAGGREALALLAAEPVDLVLLDVMMPEMPGDEVLRRLKADPQRRDIPVLMVSALDELDRVVRCIELGADDYLPKPFDPVLLTARIGACLEKKRLRDQEIRHARELAEWNQTLEQRVREKVAEVERLGRLKRFFSPQLAELIVAGDADDPLKTHRRDITVVFLDLRGFTAFAELAEPEEVMGVLREYHQAMGELILEHEGTLERFTGDGMMIFFNDPVPVPDAAARAVRMALAMRERVAALASAWRRRGHVLALGIGIAEGYATLGAIGYEGRWDYAAIGTVTNLAARLCGEAKGGQILVSSRIATAVEGIVPLEEMGTLTLRGLSRPVPTFNVGGVEPAG